MKVLELFCGTKSISKAFEERGHETFTVDFDKKFDPDLCIDVLDFTIDMLPEEFRYIDVAWFSPPCTRFSVSVISKHWRDCKPITAECYIALATAIKCKQIIKELKPRYYFIENPRGMLRNQHFMEDMPRKTVTYCQYGMSYQKPTDIWTNCTSWIPKMCRAGDSCHEYQPRTYKSKIARGVIGLGTQGLANAEERGIIPAKLCQEIVSVCEGKLKIKQEVLQS